MRFIKDKKDKYNKIGDKQAKIWTKQSKWKSLDIRQTNFQSKPKSWYEKWMKSSTKENLVLKSKETHKLHTVFERKWIGAL